MCYFSLSICVYTYTQNIFFFLFAVQLTEFMFTLHVHILSQKRKGRLGQILHCYSRAA